MTPAELERALARLDALLAAALGRAEAERGPQDPFRGLYLRGAELARELAREPLRSVLAAPAAPGEPLRELASLGLDGFDADVVLLALAPELDLRYARAFAYLQDDVTRRRPSPALALDLLCATPEERVARRRRFTRAAPLLARRVLSLVPQGAGSEPLLAQGLALEPEILELLLGGAGVTAPLEEPQDAGAAGEQEAPALDRLAVRIEPAFGWDDLVVPEDTLRQLRELCARARDRRRVLDEWGFGSRLARGRGVAALLAGPSGTGKTMAAEVVARELGLALYRVDLAGVVSKYVGETEKNLDRVFAAAESGSAVLLFDEADALFGRRSEVRDAHDRYANVEVAYLLQRIEAYDGLVLLTSNLAGNVDEAFARRLSYAIHFPFPEAADRRRIWRAVWPAEAPVGDDVDLDVLARELRLAGGGIRNAALAAAFEAAADGGVVRMEHVLHGARREFQKLGRELDLSALEAAA